MADEWSKPVKLNGGWYMGTPDGESVQLASLDGQWRVGDLGVTSGTGEAASAPRDVVLRLLAAEASDRLGWVWEVDTGDWIASGGKSMWGRHAETGEPITYDDHFGFTADDLLASLHGRFLLADALREAGQ